MSRGKFPGASTQLIVQALNAAETNIKLAKQLLSQARPDRGPSASDRSPQDIPGIVGIFEGTEMVTQKGERFRVNPNYASKSVLVFGDTLKKIEEDGRERFKQIERVKRESVEGVLAKKDGRLVVVTKLGSYNVLTEAVEFHGASEGSEVVVVIPAGNKKAPFAALESVKKKDVAATPASTRGGQASLRQEKKPVVEKPIRKEIPKKTVAATKPAPMMSVAPKKPIGKKEEERKPKKSVVARVTERVVKEVKPEPKPAAPTPMGVEDDEELR